MDTRMEVVKVRIEDTDTGYRFAGYEGDVLEIPHGEILKCLVYINKTNIQSAYKEYFNRKNTEMKLDENVNCLIKNNWNELNPELLTLNQKWGAETKEDKLNMAMFDFKECRYLAQSVVSWRMGDDLSAVIGKEASVLLTEVIAADMFNEITMNMVYGEVHEAIPDFFNIEKYSELFEELLVYKKCNQKLIDYVDGSKFEMEFSILNGSETFFITSLGQLVQLEIKNMVSNKKHNLQYCNCEICGRIYSRRGKGCSKIVRCNYPYKVTCDNQAKTKTALEAYKITLGRRIRKHNERNGNLIDSNIDWKFRADKKISELVDSDKTVDEIIEYMNNIWWKTVSHYGKITGIDWSDF